MQSKDLNQGAGEQPDMMKAADQAGTAAEQCVPVEALAVPGEDDKLNNPEVGDPVSYQVDGKVSRIEGDMAYVTPQAVNGKPVSAEASKTTDEPGDQERQELYDMAQARDNEASNAMPGGMGGLS